jgi:hypothetical protein
MRSVADCGSLRNRTTVLIDWLRAYVRIKWDAR